MLTVHSCLKKPNNTFDKKRLTKHSPATSHMCTCTAVCTSALSSAFALRVASWASALHIQVEHILGEAQRGPNGKQLAALFLSPMVSWVVDRHHGYMGCCPYARLEDIPFEMLTYSITSWRNSLHVPSGL